MNKRDSHTLRRYKSDIPKQPNIAMVFEVTVPVSVSVQSDHTSLLPLAFLFSQSAYPVKLNFDLP